MLHHGRSFAIRSAGKWFEKLYIVDRCSRRYGVISFDNGQEESLKGSTYPLYLEKIEKLSQVRG